MDAKGIKHQLYKMALDADKAFAAAAKKAGYGSRWDVTKDALQRDTTLRAAYDTKVAADAAYLASCRS